MAKKDREANVEHLNQLTGKLRKGLHERINYIHENSNPENSLPGTLNISFEYIEGESLILRLDMEGICVSTGSACTSGSMEPSHVLAALGLPPKLAQGTVRFSLGKDNTQAEIDEVIDKVPKIVEQMRGMVPAYKKL